MHAQVRDDPTQMVEEAISRIDVCDAHRNRSVYSTLHNIAVGKRLQVLYQSIMYNFETGYSCGENISAGCEYYIAAQLAAQLKILCQIFSSQHQTSQPQTSQHTLYEEENRWKSC